MKSIYLFRHIVAVTALLLMAAGTVIANERQFVLTLDAGHGGKDYGAIGQKSNEKTITLNVVRSLGEIIEKNLPDVKVVYTRKDDRFVELSQRAAIANEAKSDLFMSVHINSVDKRNRNRRNITGCQVYTLGLHKTAENLAVAKRENAVMELEADHTEKYAGFDPSSLESDIIFELSQNKRLDQSIEFADAIHSNLANIAHRAPKGVRQAGFWVLWATSMPSVLVELDFICNPAAEKYLISDDGQKEMVTSLYNAICAYINTYGSQTVGRNLPPALALDASGETSTSTPHLETSTIEAPSSENAVNGLTDMAEETELPRQKRTTDIEPIDPSDNTAAYFVQILATDKPLSGKSPELKGLSDVQYYTDGGMYKYAVGKQRELADAKKLLRDIKKKFPNSFIIKMVAGKRVDFIKP